MTKPRRIKILKVHPRDATFWRKPNPWEGRVGIFIPYTMTEPGGYFCGEFKGGVEEGGMHFYGIRYKKT